MITPLLSIGQMIEFLIDKEVVERDKKVCDDLWDRVRKIL